MATAVAGRGSAQALVVRVVSVIATTFLRIYPVMPGRDPEGLLADAPFVPNRDVVGIIERREERMD